MKTYIPKILGKLSDYWVCKECNGLNWYENEECSGENQGCECKGKQPKSTDKRTKKVLEWIDVEIEDRKDIRCSNCECKEDFCEYNENELDSIEIYV